MRILLASLAMLAAAAACGGGSEVRRTDGRSWAQLQADAEVHDRAAAEHAQAAEGAMATRRKNYACGDTVLNDQLTTGGVRVTTWQPCFDVAEEAAENQRFLADRERDAARADRRAAEQLLEAEIVACSGIPDREREHSVFAHRKEIAKVIPHSEAGELRGAWIVFKPVAGMTAAWVRQDIDCHRARWALLGKRPTVMPDNPTLVDGAAVQVFDRTDHVEVLVTANDPTQAEVVLARAEDRLSAADALVTR